VWISINGETKFSYDEMHEIYFGRPKNITIITFDGKINVCTNIDSVFPDFFIFNSSSNDKIFSISFSLEKCEINMTNEIQKKNDLARIFLNKPIEIDRSHWRAVVSEIQFIQR